MKHVAKKGSHYISLCSYSMYALLITQCYKQHCYSIRNFSVIYPVAAENMDKSIEGSCIVLSQIDTLHYHQGTGIQRRIKVSL